MVIHAALPVYLLSFKIKYKIKKGLNRKYTIITIYYI